MGYRIKTAFFALLLVFISNSAFSQTNDFPQRGSIPEELLRPHRDEAPRYPIDTVIGPIGQGTASVEAYGLARRIAAALLAGDINARALSSVKKVFLEGFVNALSVVNPRYFRLGSGREEPDGSVSFLVRFAGRDQGITGELYIRLEEQTTNPSPPEHAPPIIEKRWVFEDLILEPPRTREEETLENRQRYDFSPYERFF